MQELAELGQSIWLDYIDRPLLETGKLSAMIKEGLQGMTSNPSIFNNAIGASADYDERIKQLTAEGKSTFEIYDDLTIKDIQDATDHFKEVYEATAGLDGYVSLEIDPQIAHKAEEQIKEGKRLYAKVNRPNVMIKVPSTEAGIPVIEELIACGINVNATLIFSVEQYSEVAKAYYRGLNRRAADGGDLSGIRSVASVFISRIDTAVDKLLDERIAAAGDDQVKASVLALKGKAAVANSRIVYERWQELLDSDGVKALSGKNANVQRVLWASTGTKNSDYSDIKYVTELITAPTVNTLPEKTLHAFIDHGEIKDAFTDSAQGALEVIESLRGVGIDIDQVCAQLLKEGVDAFDKAFVELSASIEQKAEKLCVK